MPSPVSVPRGKISAPSFRPIGTQTLKQPPLNYANLYIPWDYCWDLLWSPTRQFGNVLLETVAKIGTLDKCLSVFLGRYWWALVRPKQSVTSAYIPWERLCGLLMCGKPEIYTSGWSSRTSKQALFIRRMGCFQSAVCVVYPGVGAQELSLWLF